MARAIRSTILLALATGAIVLALLLTGVLGGAGPSPAGAATKGATERAGESAEPAGESATEPAGESESATEPAGESATEPAGESESATEPAGESQPGHQDAQGEQVDHQCPPACTAGEKP